jgi:hypothetical protein
LWRRDTKVRPQKQWRDGLEFWKQVPKRFKIPARRKKIYTVYGVRGAGISNFPSILTAFESSQPNATLQRTAISYRLYFSLSEKILTPNQLLG